jgi:hypothetical protein
MIVIDPEFKALIPPLSAEERRTLEDNLLADGCRDAIVTWNSLIIDGHNRYEICTAQGIPYSTVGMDFDDRADAIIWIIRNQLGRRNLTEGTRISLARQFEGIIREKAKAQQGSRTDIRQNSDECQTPIRTDEQAARLANVSRDTYRKGVSILDSAPAPIKDKYIADGISTNAAHNAVTMLKSFDDLPEETKPAVANALEVLQAAGADKKDLNQAVKVLSGADRREKEERRQRLADTKASFVNLAKSGDTSNATVRNIDAIAFLESLEPHSADLLFTDPPYSTDIKDIRSFANTWLPLALSRVKPTGRAYVCTGAYPQELLAYLDTNHSNFVLAQILVWAYRNTIGPTPKIDYIQNWQAILYFTGPDVPPLDCPVMTEQFAVQDINAPDGRLGNRFHPWQKPDELAERFIRHSTVAGASVIDPFAGTGTFLAAAARLGRIGVGSEIDCGQLELCAKRGITVI